MKRLIMSSTRVPPGFRRAKKLSVSHGPLKKTQTWTRSEDPMDLSSRTFSKSCSARLLSAPM